MKLIYVFDPLCGWCYGFSPVIQQFVSNHPELDVEVISGGMVTGSRVGPLSDIAPYLRRAYKDVEERTGVFFGKKYLEELFSEANMIMNSEPSSMALSIIKKEVEDSRQHLLFASKVQHAIYFDGMHPEDQDGLATLMSEFGIDKVTCASLLESEIIRSTTHLDYKRAESLGVTGYPAILLVQNGEVIRLSSGYTDLSPLEERYAKVSAVLKK